MTEQKPFLLQEIAAVSPRRNPAEVRLNLLETDGQSPDLSPRAQALFATLGKIAETEAGIDANQRKIADQGVTLGFAFGELVAQPAIAAARVICQAVCAMAAGDEIKDRLLRRVELAETWRSFRDANNQTQIVPYVKENARRLAVKHQTLIAVVNQMQERNLIRIAPDNSIVTFASSDQQETAIVAVIDDLDMTQRLLQMHRDRPTALTIATRRARKFTEAARDDARQWGIAEVDIHRAIERGKNRFRDLAEV